MGSPASHFVFELVGLSCFPNSLLTETGMRIAGTAYRWPYGIAPPPELLASGTGLLAARPTEINFVGERGIRGRVLRKAYLGETIDYRIMVGDADVRVQKTRHVPPGFDSSRLKTPIFCSTTPVFMRVSGRISGSACNGTLGLLK
jgi:iron(III) transport system ATP-binding protein